MSNQLSESFPATRQDLSDLKKSAIDAGKDLSSTAGVHAEKVKGQVKDLANHAQAEGSEQWDRVKGSASDLTNSFRDYVTERPIVALGTALAIGFLFGLTRSFRSSRD